MIFPDWFIYNPNDTPEIANGEYEFNYKDHEGYTSDIADSFFRSLMDGPLGATIANSKRKVEVYKSPKIGKVNLYPSISLSSRKFILTYNYIVNDSSFNPEANLPFRFQSQDAFAIKLEFSYLGACLEFLNQIIFYDNADTDFLKGPGSRQLFYDSYSRIVNNAIQWGLGESVERALEILYYAPRSFLIDINLDLLWEILEKALQSTTVTNWGLNKEDIVLELLKTLGTAEKTKNIFLLKLLDQYKKKENLFSLLYRKMNGDNFVKYVKFIHEIWKESRFRIPDIETNPEYDTTDGKLFLPYRSEKWLGIYSSNTDVSFEGSLIKVELETGNYKTVEVPPDAMGSSPKTIEVEIIDRFKYHPFYPVYIENVEKQETEIKFETIIPAFMLKANEDKEFWHNAIKTGEYTLDVVTTLSGIGNLAKFRHLTKLAEIAAIANDVSNANKIIRTANVLRYVKGAAGVVEITSGSVNAMLKLTGLDETESGRSLSKVLFFLELITLTGELTVSLNVGLKKAAKEAIEKSNPSIRKANRELFDELYLITGIDELGRKILKVENIEDLGKQGNKVIFKLLDNEGNEIGNLIRTIGNKGRKLSFELKLGGKTHPISSTTELLNLQMAKAYDLPVSSGENIMYADINIPTQITDEFSGLGNIMLDDTLAFYLKNPKFGTVDGSFGVWVNNPSYYNQYGGQSINLTQFWKAVDEGMSYENAAFETFTGKWAKKNGFEKPLWRSDKDVKRTKTIMKFLKD